MVKFVIFICLIVVSVGFAEELPNPIPTPRLKSKPEQNSSTDINQETHQPNTPSKKLPTPINLQNSAVVSKSDVQDSSEQPGQSPPKGWRWTWNEMTILTLALVFVGSIQAYVYCRQAKFMREGLKRTEESNRTAKQAADAATKSADAAKQSADITDLTLKSGERAYLSTRQWKMINSGEGSKAQAICSFANAGKTLGWITAIYCDPYLSEQEPNTLNYRQATHTYAGKRIAIHPQEERHLPIDAPNLGPDDYVAIRDGKKRLYFYAAVVYEDIFLREQVEIFFVWYDPQNGQFNEIFDSKYYQTKEEDA